jgi:hypothetical protein
MSPSKERRRSRFLQMYLNGKCDNKVWTCSQQLWAWAAKNIGRPLNQRFRGQRSTCGSPSPDFPSERQCRRSGRRLMWETHTGHLDRRRIDTPQPIRTRDDRVRVFRRLESVGRLGPILRLCFVGVAALRIAKFRSAMHAVCFTRPSDHAHPNRAPHFHMILQHAPALRP